MKKALSNSGIKHILALAIFFLGHLRNVIGIFFCIIIMILLNSSHDFSRSIKERAATMVSSTYAVITSPLSLFSSWPDFFYNYMLAVEENAILKRDINTLSQELSNLKLELGEARSLKQQLNFSELNKPGTVSSRIISYNDSSFGHIFALNIGSAEGVNVSDVVVNNNILLGKIIDVSTHAAKIQSTIDSSSRIPAITSDGRQKMIVGGNGIGNFITPIFLNTLEQPKDGDLVITSGDGGIFPYGLVIGSISLVGSKFIIKPALDLLDLEFAQVLIRN